MAQINLRDFLLEALQRRVSDVYMIPGCPMTITIAGQTSQVGDKLTPADTEQLIRELYRLACRDGMDRLYQTGDDNFSFSLPSVSRFRVSTLRQRNSYGCIIRMIPFDLPTPEQCNIPQEVMNICDIDSGLVLVAGMSRSGKSTTISCLLEQLNNTRPGQLILTLENPIESVYRHKKCIVVQREIFTDTKSYADGLDAAWNQHANILMVSNLPDNDTARGVLRMAQSGSFVITTMPGTGAVPALQNLMDMFLEDRQATIRKQLASTLRAVVFQQMVPSADGKILPVFEILSVEEPMRQLIADGNLEQISANIAASKTRGVVPFDRSLVGLFNRQRITFDVALKYARNKELIRRQLF